MIRGAILSSIVLGFASTAADAADCVMENGEIQLIGSISRETFPGPPNYQSVANGDRPETTWVLTVAQPVPLCSGSSQQRFQLVLRDEQYGTSGSLAGAVASVKGQIWMAHTGHHHTPMLITVTDLGPVVASAAPARCAARFSDFLVQFESDPEVRLGSVNLPLPVSYVDAAASPEPAQRTKELSREEYVASGGWYPAREVQTERRLEKQVTALENTAVVHFNQPDSDAFSVDFHFRGEAGCWRLVLVDDHSL